MAANIKAGGFNQHRYGTLRFMALYQSGMEYEKIYRDAPHLGGHLRHFDELIRHLIDLQTCLLDIFARVGWGGNLILIYGQLIAAGEPLARRHGY